MRRWFQFGALEVSRASSRVASSFFNGGNSGGSRRQSRERTRESMASNLDVDNRVERRGLTPASLSGNALETSSRTMKKTELLFPDAQTHELGDMEVVDGHENVMSEEKLLLLEEEEDRDMHAPPNLKRRYDCFVRPKREAVVFTSSFADRVSAGADKDEEDDVTKIYSPDEVVAELNNINSKRNLSGVTSEVMPTTKSLPQVSVELDHKDWDDNVAKIHTRADISRGTREAAERKNTRLLEKSACDLPEREGTLSDTRADYNCDEASEEGVEGAEYGSVDEDGVDEVLPNQSNRNNDFENVRKHPFFADLLRRMEKNALRQRQQIKSTGRYNLEAVNLCLRPLLQLTDYPFTIRQLNQMAPFLYPNLLRRSLPDIKACRRLHIYRSADTDVVLDWSVEDFLRRRYESTHLSWEPVKIVMLRFGWNHEVMSDRDCLLYFSRFQDYIELAELELSAGDDKPRAIPIEDAARVAEQRPIPVSKLLIRRKPVEETEPSVTEAIRLMGTPALLKPAKSRKAQTSEKDSVEGTFERIQREAASVDGDETARLRHAIDAVPFLHQASHPSGRSIKDFSLGKQRNAVISESIPRSSARVEANLFDEGRHAYTPELYEALANAYHKKKVEASQLRRRLLNTDSIDDATELQEKLAIVQKELPRLRERLEKMRQFRRMEKEGSSTGCYTLLSHVDKHNVEKTHTGKVEAATSLAKETSMEEILGERDASTMASNLAQSDPIECNELEKNCNAAGGSLDEKERTDGVEKSETETYHGEPHYTVPVSEEVKSLSSAALMLRKEIEILQEKRRHEEEAFLKKMEETLSTLLKIEATMSSVLKRESKEAEQQRLDTQQKQKRELMERQAKQRQAEARARALEEELLRKHEERVRVLSRQREEARHAQREAELALERQKQAEQATLEAEAELERRLKEAKSKIWSEQVNGESTPVASKLEPSIPMLTSEDTKQSTKSEVSCTPSPFIANTNNNTAEPTCTPEQYDGLCLGAERLRKEIMELERQMENEGDEDDMTLMAVLATSRSDLEELEDFICVVRQRESWAAERDRARKEETERLAKQRGDRPNDVQEKISAIRFQIDLMEKRLQHASERSVISKLEQRIINARRDINRLRVEQDRLRRSGLHADAGGIYVPSSISIAETLAEAETKNTESIADLSNEAGYTAEERDKVNSEETDMMHTRVEEMGERGARQHDIAKGVEINVTDMDYGDETDAADDVHNNVGGTQQHEEELRQLTNKMENMLEDIRHLEENIALKKDGRDAETTAASLAELQAKLQQLLEVRDAIKSRMGYTPLDENALRNAPSTFFSAAESATKMKKPAESCHRPAVLAPPSNRPVSGHTSRADAEVLRFQHHTKTTQQLASHRSSASGRKVRRITKSKKTCR